MLLLAYERRYLGRWCSETVTADSGKPCSFIQCEKKSEWICSNASTSVKYPLSVWDWVCPIIQCAWVNSLIQRGITGFDLYGPFYKILRVTSNKMLCKTTESHWNYYTSANSNLLKISTSEMPVVEISLTLSFLHQTQHVSCSTSETVA